MKIGMIGTGSTGKTTTLNLLGDNPSGFDKMGSVVRETFKEWHWKEEDQLTASPEEVWRFQKTCFDRKVQKDLDWQKKNFIAERSLLDHLMYCYYRCAHVIPDSVAETMFLLTKENLQKYDLLLFFPYTAAYEVPDDGLRQSGRAYRTVTDAILRGLIRKMKLEVSEIPEGTPEGRVDYVRKLIALAGLQIKLKTEGVSQEVNLVGGFYPERGGLQSRRTFNA